MDKRSCFIIGKRMFALVLSLMIGISFMPAFAGQAFATEGAGAPVNEVDAQSDREGTSVLAQIGADGQPAEEVAFAKATKATPTGGFTITVSSNGIATIKGEVQNDTFKYLYVDNSYVKNINSTTVNTTIDMKNYSIGYHTVWISLKTNTELGFVKEKVPTNIMAKPDNKLTKSRYAAYSKYFDFRHNALIPMGYDLYMTYKVGKGKWKNSGYMDNPYLWYKIGGLKPNKTVKARLCYGKWTVYNGQKYLFKGPLSAMATFKSGSKKLKIKKVKVKAVKIKKRTGVHYGYYTGLYLGKYRYYSYKIKVTVYLKKKPGAKGIYINGKRVKGNKKKYTATFGPYTNYTKPKGKKFTVYAYSYKNTRYGGYSPMYKKTKRVR